MSWRTKWATLCLLVLTVTSCTSAGNDHSELFFSIFKDEQSTFRGSKLGVQLETVRNRETGSLTHDDERGFVYNVNLGDGREMVVEYYKDPRAMGKHINRLMAINADIELRDEVEAVQFYEEVSNHFTRNYGFAEGQSGDNLWTSAEDSLEANLRLSDNKSGLNLYFVWMDPENL